MWKLFTGWWFTYSVLSDVCVCVVMVVLTKFNHTFHVSIRAIVYWYLVCMVLGTNKRVLAAHFILFILLGMRIPLEDPEIYSPTGICQLKHLTT